MINRSGAWYTMQCLIDNQEDPMIKAWILENKIEDVEKAFKFQGMEKVTTFLEQNPDMCNFIYDQIREILI